MSWKWTLRAGAAAIVMAASASAYALDAASVGKARHDYFHQLGKAMKGAGDELKKPEPSMADVKAFAAALDKLAPALPTYFPAGSGPESGVKTEAKAEIWTKPADFQKAVDAFTTAAHAYDAAAQTGDVNATRAAWRGLGKTCGGCHDSFRNEERNNR
jgi:cytochrome c556